MTKNLRNDQVHHEKQLAEVAREALIETIRARLDEFKTKMSDELQLSAFNKKKTPTAVLNYLTSIVTQYMECVPEQPALYVILTQIRDNELIRCLLNLSIYLGTIEKPEILAAELKRLFPRDTFPNGSGLSSEEFLQNLNMSQKDRRKLRSMMQQQQETRQHPDPAFGHQPVSTFCICFEQSF